MALKKKDISYIPLISHWEEYLASTHKDNLHDFAIWLLEKQKSAPAKKTLTGSYALDEYFEQHTDQHNYAHKSSEAAFLLWRLSKFVRFYTKPILLANGLTGQDDFAILSQLDYTKECTKKEAIHANIIDPTTGVDMIRRLIREGLILERVNKTDKREKLISLSASGKKRLQRIYEGFSGIQDVLAGLNREQRDALITVLQELDEFHTRNHQSIVT